MVTLLDYGAGNVRSVINAIELLGEEVRVAADGADILAASRLVFPGVGNFGEMMRVLRERRLDAALLEYLRAGRPFLGICLGMQALFEGSDEAPGVPGLGLLRGRVRRFPSGLSVPHMGWNGLTPRQDSTLFAGLSGEERFYFVHSYYVECGEPAAVLATTDYGLTFTSAVQAGAVCATQFHPEKSGPEGLRLLGNFLRPAGAPVRPPRPPARTALARRVVACLDVRANDEGDLVVTKGDRYDVREEGRVRNLGAPVDLAARYYREGADEIVFLNITGFRDFPLADLPMLEVLRRTSEQVFVPLAIGGGIRGFREPSGREHSALDVAAAYFRSGADKVSIGGDAVLAAEEYLAAGKATGRSSIEQISRVYGRQAVVVSVDPRRVWVPSPEGVPHRVIPTEFPGPRGERFCWYQCTVKGGREGRPIDAVTFARACEELGAGEILLNCIDRDGTNAGFDLELVRAVRAAVSLPLIASSGAGSAEHFREVFAATGVEAALAAGIFHRREVPIASVKDLLGRSMEVRRTGTA